MNSNELFFPDNLAAGYYGKVPQIGDFITQRVSQNTVSIWDHWLRHGLYEMKSMSEPAGLTERCHTKAIWNFILPPAVAGQQLIGLIGASNDRVGRQFPFTLFKPIIVRSNQQIRLEHIAPFFLQHGPIIRALQQRQLGLERLEHALNAVSGWEMDVRPGGSPATSGDIFEVLSEETTVTPVNGMLPWPGLSLVEIMHGDSSYWWTNQAAGGSQRAFTHRGSLNGALLRLLFEISET